MRTIYFVPGSAAMAPQAALEEAGLDYQAVQVERRDGVPVSPPGYLQLHPHGRVPLLVEDGLVLWESAAIVLHVAERHPESGLLPPVASDARSHAVRWLIYLTNTVQATLMWYLYPERVAGADEPSQKVVRDGAARQLESSFHWIDGELAGREFLLGDEFSAPDLYLHMVTRWGRRLPRPAWSLPSLGRHYALLSERPAVARTMERQGIEAYPSE